MYLVMEGRGKWREKVEENLVREGGKNEERENKNWRRKVGIEKERKH